VFTLSWHAVLLTKRGLKLGLMMWRELSNSSYQVLDPDCHILLAACQGRGGVRGRNTAVSCVLVAQAMHVP